MTNLKHNSSLVAMALLLVPAVMPSCKEFDFDAARGETALKALNKEYDDAFAEAFGQYGNLHIDPAQAWGFEEMQTLESYLQGGTTRAANPNSNQWADYADVPAGITDEESQFVYNYLKTLVNPVSDPNPNWEDFFVQHVWLGNDTYQTTDRNGATYNIVGGSHMNLLYAANGDAVNNFNGNKQAIMLMQNSGTSDFSYHDSWSGNRYNKFVVICIPDYGYYVCFDYQTNKDDGQYFEGDGIYTDWILKISPMTYHNPPSGGNTSGDTPAGGGGQTTPPSHDFVARIMCEDLGSVDDFDFNDVVFDVAYKSQTEALITLRAAGGTLPLYIGDNKHEVHELFGVPVGTMVNTKNGSVTRDVVNFNIPVTSTNPNDIKVIVQSQAMARNYLLDANPGSAPRKICVPTSVRWANERESISLLYPNFTSWVRSNSLYWDGETTERPAGNSSTSTMSGQELAANGYAVAGSAFTSNERVVVTAYTNGVSYNMQGNVKWSYFQLTKVSDTEYAISFTKTSSPSLNDLKQEGLAFPGDKPVSIKIQNY